MQNDPSYQSLIEMGISETMAEASIKKTGSNDISTLLDWISSHETEEPQLAQWLKSSPSVQSNPQPQQGISHLVNAGFNAEIQSLGFSVNVSQKALLLNDNNKQKALKWIQDHKYDADFQEPLVLVEQPESNLTKEQAEAKLQELIKKAREKREKQQAEQALERQKNRMKSGKQALEVKRLTEEQRMRQQVELDKIEKEKDAQYRKQLLAQMEKQRCQKLGIEYVPKQELEAKKEKPKLSKSEAVYVQMEQVRVGNFGYPERAKTLFDTATIYLNNIVKDPNEPKFRRINTEGSAFQNRIASAFGGRELLEAIGFAQEGTFLVLEKPDVEELKEIVKALEKLSAQY